MNSSPLQIPHDLGLSLQYRHPFRERLVEYHSPTDDRPLPANERNMCALSASLRSKPSWWTKYTNPEIRAKWKSEAIGAPVPFGEIPLKEDEVEYVLQELAHFALNREKETGIEASIYHRIWQSDALIPLDLDTELRRCVAKLEDVPEEAKDWHPGSNRQVLDLVHPSLYCIVYGRTLIRQLDHTQHRTIKPIDYTQWNVTRLQNEDHNGRMASHSRQVPHSQTADDTLDEFLSESFSWLPTDFRVSADGTNARALGYINNLDPALHQSMYGVIEQLVVRFIPLWERVLGETAAGYTLPARTEDKYTRVKTREESYYEQLLEDEDRDWYAQEGELQLPPLTGPFNGHSESPVVDLKGTTLQVIVKLANIHLTPENPDYAGGTWHVEGMINEAIVSTGIYYYDEDNVTASKLAFRAAVDEPWNYHQDDHAAVQLIWDIDSDKPLVQDIGAVATKQGRCLAFPNIYQHQVQPFSLADLTKPGHRKIIALFLVDPHLKEPRPSTTQVPPQQQEWLRPVLREIARAPDSKAKNHLEKLPNELLDLVVDGTGDSLMSRARAEEYRAQLMEERSVMVEVNTEAMFFAEFNMCEH